MANGFGLGQPLNLLRPAGGPTTSTVPGQVSRETDTRQTADQIAARARGPAPKRNAPGIPDFKSNPLGAIGFVLMETARGLRGQEPLGPQLAKEAREEERADREFELAEIGLRMRALGSAIEIGLKGIELGQTVPLERVGEFAKQFQQFDEVTGISVSGLIEAGLSGQIEGARDTIAAISANPIYGAQIAGIPNFENLPPAQQLEFANKIIENNLAIQKEVASAAAKLPLEVAGAQAKADIETAATGSRAAAREQAQIDVAVKNLQQSGVEDEQLARGIAAGRFVVSVNPQTNERQVIDVATGKPVGAETTTVASDTKPGTAVPSTVDVSRATGLRGVVTNAVNVIADAFGAGAAIGDQKARETTEALKNLRVRTTTLLQEAVPGRPSAFLLGRLEELTVEPNAVTTGEERAATRFRQTHDMIATEIARMDQVLAEGNFKPEVVQNIRLNKTQLEGLLADYDTILDSISKDELTPEERRELQQLREQQSGGTQ